MLEIDYSRCLAEWCDKVVWDIQLPQQWDTYFAGNGEKAALVASDERSNQRVGIRTKALLWPEDTLPFCKRVNEPVGIYTRDFSRSGAGFISSIEFFPEEQVRIVLPSFWVRVQIVRVRRVADSCFETGATLMQKFEPSPDAFTHPAAA
ncbi:hypothetical protein CA13_32300 [Planctomycetes bacterium CA13]|uniref:PilZ domain-containing protein n=1 Tax=Novipirellula herctigrandis TaxID=2527986 RepID=A0A5C5Z459_9BACT|nr:hypothetical protein CA13_32300 [Planctomycetes bacterium CA13]